MKIKFINEFSENICSVPFALYQYDESLLKTPRYIDIRGIINKYHLSWLDDLQASHSKVAERFLYHTRWWWITPMSRLDARPWGQEYVLKPLFFARAVIDWLEKHPEVTEIVLIQCPYDVACYLKEYNSNLQIEGVSGIPPGVRAIGIAVRNSLWAILKAGVQFIDLCWKHVFKKAACSAAKGLVLYDLNRGDSIHSGHRYYYGNLFDALDENTVSYACIAGVKPCFEKETGSIGLCGRSFYLMDHLSLTDVIGGFLNNLVLVIFCWGFVIRKQPCSLAEKTSHVFWIHYLFSELKRLPCLVELCSYRALKKVLKRQPYEFIVYPYEEKGSERAVLLACEDRNIKTIGYTPHPQHRLTLALRDAYEPLSPKPSMYAVCGDTYVEHFQFWILNSIEFRLNEISKRVNELGKEKDQKQ